MLSKTKLIGKEREERGGGGGGGGRGGPIQFLLVSSYKAVTEFNLLHVLIITGIIHVIYQCIALKPLELSSAWKQML